jgi:hypothetical protein
MLSNKCVKFQSIPFNNFTNTNLHAKSYPYWDTDVDARVGKIALPILRKVKLKNTLLINILSTSVTNTCVHL